MVESAPLTPGGLILDFLNNCLSMEFCCMYIFVLLVLIYVIFVYNFCKLCCIKVFFFFFLFYVMIFAVIFKNVNFLLCFNTGVLFVGVSGIATSTDMDNTWYDLKKLEWTMTTKSSSVTFNLLQSLTTGDLRDLSH